MHRQAHTNTQMLRAHTLAERFISKLTDTPASQSQALQNFNTSGKVWVSTCYLHKTVHVICKWHQAQTGWNVGLVQLGVQLLDRVRNSLAHATVHTKDQQQRLSNYFLLFVTVLTTHWVRSQKECCWVAATHGCTVGKQLGLECVHKRFSSWGFRERKWQNCRTVSTPHRQAKHVRRSSERPFETGEHLSSIRVKMQLKPDWVNICDIWQQLITQRASQ